MQLKLIVWFQKNTKKGISALVGSMLIVFLTSVVSVYVTKYNLEIQEEIQETEGFIEISPFFKQALYGEWEGYFSQSSLLSGYPPDIPLKVSLNKFSKKRIEGNASYLRSDGSEVNLYIKGGLYNTRSSTRFITIEYQNTIKTVDQYGFAIMELSSNAQKMNGHFLGWGLETEALIQGPIKLTKVQNK